MNDTKSTMAAISVTLPLASVLFMAVVVNRLGGLLRKISKPTDLRFALKISRFVKH